MERITFRSKERIGFKGASLEEIEQFIENTFQRLSPLDCNSLDLFKFYSRFSQETPHFVSSETNRRLLKEAKSSDPEVSKKAAIFFTLLNLKTVLGVIKPCLTDDNDRNNDLVQYAIVGVTEKVKALNEKHSPSQRIHELVRGSILPRFLSEENENDLSLDVEEALDEILQKRMLREQVREAVEGLGFKRRIIIEMKYFDGLGSKDIALKLGVSESRIYKLEIDAFYHLRTYSSFSRFLAEAWREG